jgi:zinc and cadmium transporter
MAPTGLLILASLLIMAASVAGGLLPVLVRLTHRRLQFGLSFVSGVMLGVALFHMLPHALMARLEAGGDAHEAHGILDPLMLALVLGFLAMFVLERFAHVHQHEPPEPACDDPHHGQEGACCHGHGHDHAHGHHHGGATAADQPVTRVGATTWLGATLGMGLHSLLDGVALAASVAAVAGAAGGGSVTTLAGLGTFLAILLHKPFDAMTITTLLRASGASRARTVAVNVAFALLVPVGVVLFHTGVAAAGGAETIVPWALAFSAGSFLCIAAVDLLPEVQFHRHDRLGLSAALVLGLAIAWGVARIEAASHGHLHSDSPAAGADAAAHDHAEHAHDHAGHEPHP